MQTPIYIFQPVTLKRQDNTIGILPYGEEGRTESPGELIAKELQDEWPLAEEEAWWGGTPRFIPVKRVESIHAYGTIRINSAFLNFLAQNHIPLHSYNYYGSYTGSYWPKEPIPNGKILQAQFIHYYEKSKRLQIAKEFLRGAFHNMHSNINREQRRKGVFDDLLEDWSLYNSMLNEADSTEMLLGVEGSVRRIYYEYMDRRLTPDFQIGKRIYNPPNNPVNALISYLNSMLYASIISELYRTQLSPLVGYLHQPGRKRFPLAWDIAEIFRPLIVEGLILSMVNRKQISQDDFEAAMNGCLLTKEGRAKVVRAFEHRMRTTVRHREIRRSVSYRTLLRMEGYKLVKHLLGDKPYVSFRIWW